MPEEIFEPLRRSRLGKRSATGPVKIARAIHLPLEGLSSAEGAAELAEVPRLEFEALLVAMNLPTVWYDRSDYGQDLQRTAEAERRP